MSDEAEIGKGHLSDFADTEKDHPVIATTSEMLSTGVDLPTVRNIVLFRPVGSMALFKQMGEFKQSAQKARRASLMVSPYRASCADDC